MKAILLAVIVLAIGVTFALAGCGSAPSGTPPAPRIVTQQVTVAVPTSCVPEEVQPEPTYPFSKEDLLKAPGPDALLKELYADYRLMAARLGILEPVVQACR